MSVKQVFNSSAELNYPKVLPTLDLNFANTKTLDPRITFTRASGGSYVGADGLIKYAGVNEARFDHDPETGESLGLLIEEARTNLFTRSEDFSAAKTDVSNGLGVNVNSIESPDGTKSADKVFIKISNDSQANGLQFNTFTPVDNQPYTTSCFLKMNEMRYVRYVFQGGGGSPTGVNVDLLTGKIISSVGSPNNFSITPYPNGWYRISVTATPISTALATSGILALDPTGQTLSFLGVIGSGFYIWGIQMEQASFATSYIPTQGSTRTRAADNVSITGKNFSDFYRQDEGTVFLSHKALLGLSNRGSANPSLLFNISSSSSNGFFYNTSSNLTNIFVFGGEHGNLIRFQQASLTRNKVVFSYNAPNADYSPYVDGNKITTVTIINPYKPSSYDRLFLGPSGAVRFSGHISRFTYYPKRLLDSQLIALTS